MYIIKLLSSIQFKLKQINTLTPNRLKREAHPPLTSLSVGPSATFSSRPRTWPAVRSTAPDSVGSRRSKESPHYDSRLGTAEHNSECDRHWSRSVYDRLPLDWPWRFDLTEISGICCYEIKKIIELGI